jgi:riboflavin synthase
MFTGIVEEVGAVLGADGRTLTVGARLVLDGLRLGDSIAVDGACLTVTALTPTSFTVGTQPETIRRTTLGAARPGRRVNLERALPADGRLGGHFVQGHVDGTARLVDTFRDGDAIGLRFTTDAEITRYIVEKGFVAVDGISLTVVEVTPSGFAITLIPYTQVNVALLDKRPGDLVNIEVDIVAKYVERFVGGGHPARGRVTEEFLARHGFA